MHTCITVVSGFWIVWVELGTIVGTNGADVTENGLEKRRSRLRNRFCWIRMAISLGEMTFD